LMVSSRSSDREERAAATCEVISDLVRKGSSV
jgi:hypothetical protein